MGTWNHQSSGAWKLLGSGRTALIADTDWPVASELRLPLAKPSANHNVFALVLASKDGRSGYEIGLDGANIVIRSVEFGDPASVKNWASAAHGLDANTPFFLEVRIIDGEIQAVLNGAASAVVSWTPGAVSGMDTSPTFAGYKHFGFVSNVNGAIVNGPQVCTLVPRTTGLQDLLAAACGGDAFLVQGETARLLWPGSRRDRLRRHDGRR